MSKEKITKTCLQCQEDELLGMRDNSRQYLAIIGKLDDAYNCGADRRKPEITAAHMVERLIKAERDQRRLCNEMKATAVRKCKEADELIAALRFVSLVCNREHGSVHVGGGKMMLEMSDVLKVAIDKVGSLVNGDRGLLEGRQPQNDVDFLADIWK